MTTLPIKCSCGSVTGQILDVDRGTRLICMCDDCQAFAHWLGRADEILDPHGGTDVFQVTPAQLRITKGNEHIQCMRLSPKGLMRWYTACCKTPLANSLPNPKIPFAGTIHLSVDHQGDGRTREEALGPVVAVVNARFAIGSKPEGAHDKAPFGVIVGAIAHIVGGFFRGAHKPSPLFDERTGKPVVEPTVVPLEERKKLRAKCGPQH